MKANPWYSAGLRFECQRCSACCRGEPGYVWVGAAKIEQMAECLGLTPDEFIRCHVRRVGARQSLRELPGGDCSLWGGDGRGCLVYAVRPDQCQTFPFWPMHLRSRRAWEKLAAFCPGANKGRLFSQRQIESRTKKRAI